mgnify:CR=1 FL=1
MTTHEMIEILINYVDISPETVDCVTSLYGYNKESCEDILYWKTGYDDFDEFLKDLKDFEENA